MSNINKQALRGLSVESPFYLAECCNCGEIMPSSKLRESRNYPDDDGECHCPHCNADDCDIADSGAVGSEGVTAWNYQQKRIEALLDELEAKDKQIAELEARENVVIIKHPVIGRAYSALNRVWTEQEVRKACELAGIKLNIAAAGKGE
ncbi:ead/Ea22-like family protein [Enterobacter hormaechei subsp. xiangfangensis]|nr:ead/Ea22-like family protein [Enterobacter hormaechei subsp. xiangfangensis]MCU3465726.1 ead/Ea22-like family protein [Enterobacter hormaechei subsp. xiangfangensis]